MKLMKTFNKNMVIAVCAILACIFLAGCDGTYETASDMFTQLSDITEGNFTFSAEIYIQTDDVTMINTISSTGVVDDNMAVCQFNSASDYNNEPDRVSEPVVYIDNAEELKNSIMYAFLYSCGSTWTKDDGSYSAGTDSNTTIGNAFASLGELCGKAGADELNDEIDRFVAEVKMDETAAACNTTLSLKKNAFAGSMAGSVEMDEVKVSFTITYTLTGTDINYNSSEEYVTLGTALKESYKNSYLPLAIEAGIREAEEEEITSHVVDGSSLIIQGFDDLYYKTTWDGNKFNYSDGDLEFGEWELTYADDSTVAVDMNMFGDTIENYISWCETTYGTNMEMSHSETQVETKVGEMTVFEFTTGSGDNFYKSTSYLYQVNDEFLVRITVNNTSLDMSDEELVDLAFSSFKIYEYN